MSFSCDPERHFGVYVHVPFCRRRCPYCDFSVVVRARPPVDAFVDALLHELEARAHWYRPFTLSSVYFGGGTPSLLGSAALTRIRQRLDALFGGDPEYCIELNPEDVDEQRVAQLRALGFARVSLGVQSFDEHVLTALGRAHSGEHAMRALELVLGADFRSVNVDLIHGLAAQSEASFRRDHALPVAMGVPHLSSYGLTIEAQTRFGRMRQRGIEVVLPEDAMAERFEQVAAMLEPLYRRYEVSNFALPGHLGRHNLLYWLGARYLGLGPGAHSLWRDAQGQAWRRANQTHFHRYLEQPQKPDEVEQLSPPLHLAERLFMQLRTTIPIELERLHGEQERLAPFLAAFAELHAAALVDYQRGPGRAATLSSTPRGLQLHEISARRIMACVDDECVAVQDFPEAALSAFLR